jgi:hypothetical protein
MDKIEITKILKKDKMFPKCKARINIPLCKMISMPIVFLGLKIDVLKMEQTFHFGYQEGDKVLYVSPLNWKG